MNKRLLELFNEYGNDNERLRKDFKVVETLIDTQLIELDKLTAENKKLIKENERLLCQKLLN